MNVFSVCGFAVLCTVLCTVLRSVDKQMSVAVSIAAAAMVALFAVSTLSPVAEYLRGLSKVAETGLKTVLKALGISFFCSLACDICKESGENALSKQLEFAGKCVLCALCLPVISELSSVISGLVN